MAKPRLNLKPNPRYLLPSRKRVKQPALNPAKNAKHFHHLAEMARLRNNLTAWFEAEKAGLGFGNTKEAQFLTQAQRSHKWPQVERLLRERDRKTLALALDLAGIKQKKKRSAVLARAKEFIAEMGFAETDVHTFFMFFDLIEKEGLLSKSETLAFRKAFADWVAARTLFKSPMPSFQ